MSEAKKTKYRGFTPAQAEAHKRYMKDFVEIKVRMKADKRTSVQKHAANMGESTTAFINRAIDETMEHDISSPNTESMIKDTMNVVPEQKPEKRYEPFTQAAAASIDLEELLEDDGGYRSQIAYKFGIDVLNQLLEKARQQKKENSAKPS